MEKAGAFSKQIISAKEGAIKAAAITEKKHKVTITDINMPFISMVSFMVKAAIAAIPAMIILYFLAAMFAGVVVGLLGK